MSDLKVSVDIRAKVGDALSGVSKLKSSIDKLNKSDLKQVSRSLKDIGSGLNNAGRKLSLAVTTPLTLLGGLALKGAANLEQLEVAFEGLTGSAENSRKTIKNLIEFTGRTPFNLEQVSGAARTLLSFGVNAKDLEGQLKTLGDISAGSGSSLKELSLIYGKVLAQGKLSGETFLQFAERGIPLNKTLADILGVQESQIKKMISAGKIGLPELNAAFAKLTTGSGQFANQLEKQSKTLTGAISTLKDNVSLGFADIGKTINEAFNITGIISSVTNFVSRLRQAFAGLDESTKKIIIVATGLVAALGPLLIALGSLVTFIGVILPGLAAVGGALLAIVSPIGLVVGGIAALALRFTALKSAGLGTFGSLKVILVDLLDIINTLVFVGFNTLINTAIKAGNLVRGALGKELIPEINFTGFDEQLNRLREGIIESADIKEEDIPGIGETFKIITDKILPSFKSVGEEIDSNTVKQDNFNDSLGKASEKAKTFKELLAETKVKSPAEIGLTAAQSAADGLTGAFSDFSDGTKSASEAFSNFAKSFLKQIGQMIVRAALLQAIQAAFSATTATGGVGNSTGSSSLNAGAIAATGGFISGGQVTQRFAEGGEVTGPGSGTSDSIKAMLSNGEFVSDARTVAFHGVDLFKQLKSAARGGLGLRQPSFAGSARFAEGGFVGAGGSDSLNSGQSSTAASMSVEIVNNGSSDSKVTNVESISSAKGDILRVFIDDLKVNGPAAKAFAGSFGLRRKGIK